MPSPTPRLAPLIAATSLALAATTCLAQTSTSINLAGLQIRNATNQSRSSAPNTLTPAYRYSFRFSDDTMVQGQGVALGSLYPQPTPLTAVVDGLQPGASENLRGAGNNPTATHPYTLPPQSFTTNTTVSGIPVTFGLTLNASANADNTISFSLTNVVINPSILVGYLVVTQGSLIVETLCASDYDLDGCVTIDVLLLFVSLFQAGDAAADTDGDSAVTIDDLLEYLPHFYSGC